MGHGIALTAGLDRLSARVDENQLPHVAVGDRVQGPVEGIVVDLDADAVVVARRNAQGRCMDVVFVGDSMNTLRRA